jgi:hypothetical protein
MEKKRRMPILKVVRIEGPAVNRFVIKDQLARVWNGKRFGADGGALYAKSNDAAADIHKILKCHFIGVEPQRFVVPVYIEVFNEGPMQLASVAQYLSKSSRLYIDTDTHGNGPKGSLVLPVIEWGRIEQIKEFPNE